MSDSCRLAWLTDVHLNFVTRDRFARLLYEIECRNPDAVLLGGDISDGPAYVDSLTDLAEQLDVPIYFVLGNHDAYRWSIASARNEARRLTTEVEQLHWLPDAGVVRLTERTALVGHGGWGDGRAGPFLESDVVLNDYLLIEELRRAAGLENVPRGAQIFLDNVINERLLAKLQELGDEAAAHFRRVLPESLEAAEHVVVLTHVPPFREACWHQGRTSDDNWAPHFTCVAVGHVLQEFMQRHPDRQMTVLCGHTHGAGRAQVLPNLEVITGGTEYGDPCVQEVLVVE